MKNEIYVWMIVLVVIVAVALYVRYFYQPTLSVTLSVNSTATQLLYPYQKVIVNIGVFNNGSSTINNMSIGIFVNDNLTSLYKVTLPVGKETSISYNYSPTLSGTYVINAVADPGKLYNLENRPNAQANTEFTVIAAQAAGPEAILPRLNMISIQGENFTRGGYLLSSYLANQYNMSSLSLTKDVGLNKFLTPVLNLTSYYIKNISVANADYKDGSRAHSLWIKGYLAPNIFSVAAAAAGLPWNNYTTSISISAIVGGGVEVLRSSATVTLVDLAGGTTFCSWYDGGWLKTLSYSGRGSCLDLLNTTASNVSILNRGIGKALYDKIAIINASLLGNYSGVSGNIAYAAKTFFFGNVSFIYAGISNNTPQSNTCYGIISVRNGTYYCSTYLLPESGSVQSLSLVRTTAYIGSYNFTVMSLVNTSLAISQVRVGTDLIDLFKTPGISLTQKSGIVNTCSFNSTFGCGNLTYLNGSVTFKLTNLLNTTLKLNSAECYTLGSVIPFPTNVTLGSGESTTVGAACYGLSGKLSGFVLGQRLKLAMNYSVANVTTKVLGSAFVPFG